MESKLGHSDCFVTQFLTEYCCFKMSLSRMEKKRERVVRTEERGIHTAARRLRLCQKYGRERKPVRIIRRDYKSRGADGTDYREWIRWGEITSGM